MDSPLHCVYLLASRRGGTLYVGATSRLAHRVHQHKTGAIAGFTRTYGVDRLVWFEVHGDARSMVVRERQIKEWRRAWKVALIEAENPMWRDLYGDLVGTRWTPAR